MTKLMRSKIVLLAGALSLGVIFLSPQDALAGGSHKGGKPYVPPTSGTPTATPEPMTLGLVAAGLIGAVALRRRRQD